MGTITFTSKKLAACCGITQRRVNQLRAEGVFREISPGTGLYAPTENISAYIAYIKNDGGADYYGERARFIRAKRKVAEYELDEMEGRLHSSEDVERVISRMLVNFRSRLMGIPAKLSPVLAQTSSEEKIYHKLKDAVSEALCELADYDTLFGEAEDESSNGKTDEADIQDA